jgi:hypothetical protein
MPHSINLIHVFPFYVGFAGLQTSDFTVVIFTRDTHPVSLATLDSLTITELTGGFYQATYTPDTDGDYMLALSNIAHNVHVIETVDINDGIKAVDLTQDTPTTDALKPSGTNLNEYLLMVFNSHDWGVGKTATMYALAQTELDVDGNWEATPLVVVPGTYHIIIRNNFGVTRIVKAYLTVS